MNIQTNELHQISAFKKVLATYAVSDASKSILKDIKLVLLVAPTSVGRNKIIDELLKLGNYHYIVSDTTRKPRINDGVPEKNGVEYWFRSEADVLQDLKQGAFLEAAIIHNQQVSGISVRELQRAHDDNKIPITDIEIVGAHNIIQAKPDTISIFVLPPSMDEWMRRLSARGQLEQAEIERRLTSAVNELSLALERDYYYFVVNDRLNDAVKQIADLAESRPSDPMNEIAARDLAEKLLEQTKKFVDTSPQV